jgi:hypothetical protein
VAEFTNYHPFSKLRTDKWLEHRPKHVEDVRVVDYVKSLQTQWNAILDPVQQHHRIVGSEMNDLTQRKPIEIHDNNTSVDLQSINF